MTKKKINPLVVLGLIGIGLFLLKDTAMMQSFLLMAGFPVTEDALWIGLGEDGFGHLLACNSTGGCVDYGDVGKEIMSMAVWEATQYPSDPDKIWLGVKRDMLVSDYSGNIESAGASGGFIPRAMEVLNDMLFVGDIGDDVLIRYTDWNDYTYEYDFGSNIMDLEVFDGLLWVSVYDGTLYKCFSSGSCFDYGTHGGFIESMEVFNNELWIAEADDLQSCDSDANCVHEVDLGLNDLELIKAFAGKLWVIDQQGVLYSCDSSANCINHGDKNLESNVIEVFDNRLWVSNTQDHLLSCDSSGNCIDHGYKGYEIGAMIVAPHIYIPPPEVELVDSPRSFTLTSGEQEMWTTGLIDISQGTEFEVSFEVVGTSTVPTAEEIRKTWSVTLVR